MTNNRLKELIDSGKPILGARVTIPWPRIVEVIGHLEVFDYIEFLTEGSNWTTEILENMGRALALFPNMSSMIKVEDKSRPYLTTRALASGFQSVNFANTRTTEEVRECIRLARPDTPEAGGLQFYGHGRTTLGQHDRKEWENAINDVVIHVTVETKGVMDDLDEILSMKDVTSISFGRGGYAQSIGRFGYESGPEMRELQHYFTKRALAKGVCPRVRLSSTWDKTQEAAKPYLDMGVRHFLLGGDLSFIAQQNRQQGEGMRKLLESAF